MKDTKPNKRQSLLEENLALKETIKGLQDQNTNLTKANHELEINNSIYEERLSNFGLRDLCKQLGSIGIGAAVGELINGQSTWASVIAIVSCFLLLGFSIYDNFTAKKLKKGDRI